MDHFRYEEGQSYIGRLSDAVFGCSETKMPVCVEAVNFGGHFGSDRRYQTEACYV